METFFGKNINDYKQKNINEIAEIARARGHEIKSRSDLAKLDKKEQELIYAVWVN